MEKNSIINTILKKFSKKDFMENSDMETDPFLATLQFMLEKYDVDHINIDFESFPQDFYEEIRSIFIHKKIQEKRKNIIPNVLGKTDYFSVTRHYVFTGNPGTGKSTAARLLGFFLKELGILSKGGFIEVSRSDLVGEVVGETESKTKKILTDSFGSILFINEAYQLTTEDSGKDYGKIAVQEIMKAMEDNREKFVVIVDGYHEQMRDFFKTNPGLRDRFSRHIFFEDLSNERLLRIGEVILDEFQYTMEEGSAPILIEILDYLRLVYKEKDYIFANSRTLRNLLDIVIEEQEKRIYYEKLESKNDFSIIQKKDFKNVFELLKDREKKKKEISGISQKEFKTQL